MHKLVSLFRLYRPQGLIKASIVTLRILILPFWKIDRVLPNHGTIVDIGCGAGGMSNYLSISSSERYLFGIDISKKRIQTAMKTLGKRKNIEFKLGNIMNMNFKTTNHYLMVDVLHHIPFLQQQKLITLLSKKLKGDSFLIIKEVDKSNTLPFLFGHLWEKILYPQEQICVRTKNEWVKMLNNLDLKCDILSGSPFFPNSTFVIVCSQNI